jgi:hypothetical protein
MSLERATLHAGAYPHRYGDRLGAQLDLKLREGSRTENHVRGALSASNASLVAEGPLGGSARGSWLFALRKSYLDWPVRRLLGESGGTAFAFADAHAKLVYDYRSSTLDRPPSTLRLSC